MIKTITRSGNAYGLVFDAKLLKRAGLKPGDQVDVTVHESGAIVLTPIGKALNAGEVNSLVERTVKDYRKTLRKLA
jgi:antitoxin component of MazEF toxin-antitoxin module